ncbi:hypothetical protein MMC09_004259 [Bachmanniomyces sp. S44760]|nr:hypothetical protein [Bachmanniomyces sp. S44760]
MVTRKYSTVTGYFQQDNLDVDGNTFDYTATNFGLISRSYDGEGEQPQGTQWQRFEAEVDRLNRQSPKSVVYKVLFLGRHGEGFHNVAERKYGTEAWDTYWSKLDGDGTLTWADAHLTETGIKQAHIAGHFWAEEIKEEKIPLPEGYYASPLDRCLTTATITFQGLDSPAEYEFRPVVKELLREVNGVHTCDQRSPKSEIQRRHPKARFESSFTEKDELWQPDERETDAKVDERLKRLLDDVFENDHASFVSFTSHSGAIASILRVLGHRKFPLVTGAVMPVLVRCEVGRTWL